MKLLLVGDHEQGLHSWSRSRIDGWEGGVAGSSQIEAVWYDPLLVRILAHFFSHISSGCGHPPTSLI